MLFSYLVITAGSKGMCIGRGLALTISLFNFYFYYFVSYPRRIRRLSLQFPLKLDIALKAPKHMKVIVNVRVGIRINEQ